VAVALPSCFWSDGWYDAVRRDCEGGNTATHMAERNARGPHRLPPGGQSAQLRHDLARGLHVLRARHFAGLHPWTRIPAYVRGSSGPAVPGLSIRIARQSSASKASEQQGPLASRHMPNVTMHVSPQAFYQVRRAQFAAADSPEVQAR